MKSIFSMLLINSATFGATPEFSLRNREDYVRNKPSLENVSQNGVATFRTTIKSNENEVYDYTSGKEITNVQDSKMNSFSEIQIFAKPVNICQPVSRVKNEQSGKNPEKIPLQKKH